MFAHSLFIMCLSLSAKMNATIFLVQCAVFGCRYLALIQNHFCVFSLLLRNAKHNAVMPQYVVHPSVCLSATFTYHDHRLEYFENNFTANSFKAYAWADPNMAIWCDGNTPKIGVE